MTLLVWQMELEVWLDHLILATSWLQVIPMLDFWWLLRLQNWELFLKKCQAPLLRYYNFKILQIHNSGRLKHYLWGIGDLLFLTNILGNMFLSFFRQYLYAIFKTYSGAKGNWDFFEMNIFRYINAKTTCKHVVLAFI